MKKQNGIIKCPHCGKPLTFNVGSGSTDSTISVVLQVTVKK